MTDNFFTPSEEPQIPAEETIEDAFEDLENAMSDVPAGEFITLRHEANAPVYAPFYTGEPPISVRTACQRRNLTLGTVTAYVDNNSVSLDDSILTAGMVVTLVGSVKGGA